METVSEQSVNHDERRQAAKGAGDEMTAAGKAEGKAARKAARKTGGSGKSGAKAKPGERYERGTRSYTMSHIRGKDTRIEVLVRRYLFSRGLRFRKKRQALSRPSRRGSAQMAYDRVHQRMLLACASGMFQVFHSQIQCGILDRETDPQP